MASPQIQTAIDKADELLESSRQQGLGTTIRRDRVNKALLTLNTAESQCVNKMDYSLLQRRLLTANARAIEELHVGGLVKRDLHQLLYLFDQALTVWRWLHANDQITPQDEATVSEFHRVLSDVIFSEHKGIERQDLLHGVQRHLDRAVRASKSDSYILVLFYETSASLIEHCFQASVRLYNANNWAKAMSLLKSKDSEVDVLVDLEERIKTQGIIYKESWCLDSLLGFSRAQVLREETNMQLSRCQAFQLLHSGDIHFKEAMEGDPEEGETLARALLAQDDYRVALNYAAGSDIELEGLIISRLARFFAKVIKLPVIAHQLYLRAVQLAAALAPTLPKGEWYQECVTAVQAHRDALAAAEAKEWEKQRAPILEKIADQITKLKAGERKTNAEFVAYIFKEFPPKTEGPAEAPIDKDDPSNISKKNFLKAVQRYHSDKNMGWGDEWRVLSEEICKALTARYNTMKGL
ncbi:hypothetical protein PIIN_02869 [Serendipita indica DSM 11827]|uniref:Uncharacterized protein n=1 Tax=Serendipita indica (strain DSM 11827) TaxID=1109443 RepID=G4TCG7_SERID|nr:hypothetical protein PIIN_02869 [Serendipita indica DSM 11827]